MTIEPGLEASVGRTVTEADTAMALGSGDVHVLGTPAVVALCELAAVHAVAGSLGPNETTVGVHIDIEHLAPTVPGQHVTAHATLTGIDGRRLAFNVEASDHAGEIARGTHTRVVVDRERFLRGASERT
jgi:predicted thioesterase